MAATPTGTSPAQGSFKLTSILTGLDHPVYVTSAGDGSGRLFVVEQPGRVRIIDHGRLLPKPFLDITPLVLFGGEQGLLSVAFHPDYARNGAFLVDYTRTSTNPSDNRDTIIARYKVSAADPNVADASSGETVLVVDQPPFPNHKGGLVLYGPDGDAYIGTGDGGSQSDPQGNGQNGLAMLGKMLRVKIGPTGPYTDPSDNPFPNSATTKPEIWAIGLRNPWRFSFDRLTKDLYIADVGQDAWEEIDVQPAGKGGQNYGWNVYEGTHLYRPGVVLDHTPPVAEYGHGKGDCSITGGHVYRGSKIPALQGFYVVGDYCSGRLWTLAHVGGTWSLAELMDTGHAISSFGEDQDGELYLVDLGGEILRFDAP
jgi:glucose/arabinose dehydrogenase